MVKDISTLRKNDVMQIIKTSVAALTVLDSSFTEKSLKTGFRLSCAHIDRSIDHSMNVEVLKE